MTDRKKVARGLREMSCMATWKDIDRIRHKFQPIINDAINLLNEQEDLGTELTNAVELIHKKNDQIEKLLKEQDERLRKLQKDKDKLCLEVSEWKHKFHDRQIKEQDGVVPFIDIDEAKCPVCKVKLTRQELLGDDVLFDDFFDYCPHCGTPVLWEGR